MLPRLADGDSLDYMERVKREDGTKYDTTKRTTISSHPQELTKKVRSLRSLRRPFLDTSPDPLPSLPSYDEHPDSFDLR